MMTVSDQNCDNFRSRVFAFRANSGYLGSAASGLLASGGAITALVSGPVGAGLAGASAAVTAVLAPVSGNFYSNYGMGALDSKILDSRGVMKTCMEKKMAASIASPGTAPSPAANNANSAQDSSAASCNATGGYTPSQRMADLQAYDNLCSLEIAASSPLPSPSPAPTAQPTATAKPSLHPLPKAASENPA